MIDIINLYYNYIIKPIEKECYKLEEKISSSKISDVLLRWEYKKDLKIYKQILCEQYGKLGKIISEEYIFMNELNELIKNDSTAKN